MKTKALVSQVPKNYEEQKFVKEAVSKPGTYQT